MGMLYEIQARETGTWLVLRGRSAVSEILLEADVPAHSRGVVAEVRQAILHEGAQGPFEAPVCGECGTPIPDDADIRCADCADADPDPFYTPRSKDGHLGARGGE